RSTEGARGAGRGARGAGRQAFFPRPSWHTSCSSVFRRPEAEPGAGVPSGLKWSNQRLGRNGKPGTNLRPRAEGDDHGGYTGRREEEGRGSGGRGHREGPGRGLDRDG